MPALTEEKRECWRPTNPEMLERVKGKIEDLKTRIAEESTEEAE